jgi:hypothetical protein
MKIIRNFLLLSLVFLAWSCAQILAPTGGPRDVDPPVLLHSNPLHKTTNFNGNQIKLDFDEFFTLQNPISSVLISPPLLNKPEFKIRGKSLIVSIQDTLKSNTTYSFNFANCIRDITENNTIKSLNFVVSTGDFIDSNSISGKVLNAESLLPEKEVSVMLYRSDVDSLPLTEKPYYLAKTDELGKFQFNYLSEGLYAIYAVADKNNNMMFDPPAEAFAFYHKMIESKIGREIIDKDQIVLNLFVHADTLQRINRTYSTAKGLQAVVFKNALQGFNYEVVNEDFDKNRFFVEINIAQDTVHFYDLVSSVDTIFMKISDNDFSDTTRFVTQQEPPRRASRRGGEESKSIKGQWINADHSFEQTMVSFDYPIKEIVKPNFMVIKDESDTLIGMIYKHDSLLKNVRLEFEKVNGSKYQVIIPDSSIIAYNGLVNDTLFHSFSVKEDSDYGHFLLSLQYSMDVPVILEIINEKGVSVDKKIVEGSTVLNYRNQLPQNFRVLIIFDSNKNGRWDTGNFFTKSHAESRYFFDKTISIKANWEIEESINLDEIFLKLKTE